MTNTHPPVEEREKYFEKQYLHYGGFCGTCGQGRKPILNDDIETFGLCKCYENEVNRG